ncbi:MAG: hypothetical protein IJF07_05615, partial [Lachnospiraceae bacterium]|nr:hypothetical protein [Lachnospiraceae bacterium]
MIHLFSQVIQMSLIASYCILFICLIRILLKKAPKIFSYILWAVVGFRLICPFSFENTFSLISSQLIPQISHSAYYMKLEETQAQATQKPPASTAVEEIYTESMSNAHADVAKQPPVTGTDSNITSAYVTISLEESVETIESHTQPGSPAYSANFPQVRIGGKDIFVIDFILLIIPYVWAIICCLLFSHAYFSYNKLKRKLARTAICCENYHTIPVWKVDGISSPFVLGNLKPAIYLPMALTEEEVCHCLKHEYTHICRRDYLIKQFAFYLTCIHWFNPLVWLAFYLMTKDMEMSCDETVLKNSTLAEKKAYSGTLLNLSCHTRKFATYPLAFSVNSTKSRIKNILNYKHPGFWTIFMAFVIVIICCVGLITNPTTTDSTQETTNTSNSPEANLWEIANSSGSASYDTDSSKNMLQNPDSQKHALEETTTNINKEELPFDDSTINTNKEEQTIETSNAEAEKEALEAAINKISELQEEINAEKNNLSQIEQSRTFVRDENGNIIGVEKASATEQMEKLEELELSTQKFIQASENVLQKLEKSIQAINEMEECSMYILPSEDWIKFSIDGKEGYVTQEYVTALLDKYTKYLNQSDNNTFVTTTYIGNIINLNMLFYDAGTFLENAPISAEEKDAFDKQHSAHNQEIFYHFTGSQLDAYLKEKMQLSLKEIQYLYPDTSATFKETWNYLEAYDSYTLLAPKGDCKIQEIKCTNIFLCNDLYNNDSLMIIEYEAADKNGYIKSGY